MILLKSNFRVSASFVGMGGPDSPEQGSTVKLGGSSSSTIFVALIR